MKLQIKHLTPYLPYNLKVSFEADEYEHTLVGLVNWCDEIMVLSPFNNYGRSNIKNCKPILRPLSELFKEYDLSNDYEGWQSEWIEHLWDFAGKVNEANILACPYDLMQDLLSKHFDVFNLIESGLAMDINSILSDR